MLTAISILCVLVWLPLFLGQLAQRGLLILLIWLLIAPVASALVSRPGGNPLFQSPEEHAARQERLQIRRKTGLIPSETIRLNQLFEPTRTILGSIFVVFLLDTLLKRRRLGPFDWAETWMVIFSIIMLMGVLLQSHHRNHSLRIFSDAFMIPFIAYFVTKRLVTSQEQFRKLVGVIGLVGFSLIIISLMERFAHQALLYRLAGPFRDSTSLYLAIVIPFFVVFVDTFSRKTLLAQKRTLPSTIRWFVLGLSPIIIFLTWSRGNWAGFLMSLWVFFFLARRMISFSTKLLWLGLAPLLLLVAAVSVWTIAPLESIERRSAESATVYGRFATWAITIQEGINHPVFGIGLNNMRDVLAEKTVRFGGVGEFASVHNSYLAIFAEQGTVGLVAYFAIVASIIGMGLRLYRYGIHSQDQWRGVAVIAMVVAYLVPALFASTLHGTASAACVLMYVYIGGTASLYHRQSPVPNQRPVSRSKLNRIPQNALIVTK